MSDDEARKILPLLGIQENNFLALPKLVLGDFELMQMDAAPTNFGDLVDLTAISQDHCCLILIEKSDAQSGMCIRLDGEELL